MPIVSPSRGDVHVNRPLTQVSLAFMQGSDGFVADRVFPTISTGNRSNTYFTYDRGEFNRDEMKPRAPATESAGGTYDIDQDTYLARRRSYHKDVPDEIRDDADEPIDLDTEATEYVTLKALINREVNWRNSYFVTHNPGVIWTFVADGAGTATAAGSFDPTDNANNNILFWDDPTSTPIEDIRRGKRTVGRETGFRPNILTLGREAFDVLLDHPDIVGRLDRGQTEGPAIVQREALAALFELDEVMVMDAIQNTAAKGQAAVHSFIGGAHALLSYRPPRPGRLTPSAGYTFAWTSRAGSTPNGTRVKRFRLEREEVDRVEIDTYYDQKLVAADLGYFFDTIVENP